MLSPQRLPTQTKPGNPNDGLCWALPWSPATMNFPSKSTFATSCLTRRSWSQLPFPSSCTIPSNISLTSQPSAQGIRSRWKELNNHWRRQALPNFGQGAFAQLRTIHGSGNQLFQIPVVPGQGQFSMLWRNLSGLCYHTHNMDRILASSFCILQESIRCWTVLWLLERHGIWMPAGKEAT